MNAEEKERRRLLLDHFDPDRRKFYEQHGDFIIEDGQILFQDGAIEEMGRYRKHPSKDDYERLMLVKRFWKLTAEKASEDFHYIRRLLHGNPSTDKQQQKKQLKQLEELRDEARFAQKKLRETDKAIEKTEIGQHLAGTKRNKAWEADHNQKFRDQILNVQL